MFERFTERARQVVVLAQDEARALKHNYIGTEHILLGLLREEEGLAARVLESLDITVEEVRAQVARIVGQCDEVTTGQIPFTPRAKKVLELALREALSLGHNYIGTEHILLGIDHLLFVLGLLLLVRGFIPLVKTVTAFTVAHSFTLGASVLGYIPLDRSAIEATIALSIVLLAREIVAADRGVIHLTHRKPWLVAFVFGLLHGLGLAGALGEIGLPDTAIPLALLFFNLGVEAGQLLFVLLLLAAHSLLKDVIRARLPKMEPILGYALGALATLWFFDRLPGIWGA